MRVVETVVKFSYALPPVAHDDELSILLKITLQMGSVPEGKVGLQYCGYAEKTTKQNEMVIKNAFIKVFFLMKNSF